LLAPQDDLNKGLTAAGNEVSLGNPWATRMDRPIELRPSEDLPIKGGGLL
jgi:hypothetical protein